MRPITNSSWIMAVWEAEMFSSRVVSFLARVTVREQELNLTTRPIGIQLPQLSVRIHPHEQATVAVVVDVDFDADASE